MAEREHLPKQAFFNLREKCAEPLFCTLHSCFVKLNLSLQLFNPIIELCNPIFGILKLMCEPSRRLPTCFSLIGRLLQRLQNVLSDLI